MLQVPPTKPRTHWVQTEKATHEAWAALSRRSPLASQIMHLLVARLGDNNAVIISQATLATLAQASRRGVQKALKVLLEDKWVSLAQVGSSGTVNAYVINDRVAWDRGRDGLRYSLFSATVVASEAEQPDPAMLDDQSPLRRIPSIYQGEEQLPGGDGLPPESQPFIGGLEPDLPARIVSKADTLSARALSRLQGPIYEDEGE